MQASNAASRSSGQVSCSGRGLQLQAAPAKQHRAVQTRATSQQAAKQGLLASTAALLPLAVLSEPVAAAEVVGQLADSGSAVSLAVGGGAAIAALSAALIATDPQKRRTAQTATAGGNEKDAVKQYFNTAGFERWNKIYGETDDVNKVSY